MCKGLAQSDSDCVTCHALQMLTFVQCLAGLLANLTCIQAELYEMEAAMSTGEDPLWIVPYTTIAADFQDLLDDYTTYIDVGVPAFIVILCFSLCGVGCCCTNIDSLYQAVCAYQCQTSRLNILLSCVLVDTVMGQVHKGVIAICHSSRMSF